MKRILILSLISLIIFLSGCNTTDYVIKKDEHDEAIISTDYCVVDLKGEINFPGIYSIKVGTTLYELVKLAGGFTSYADTNSLNLSLLLNGNQMVVVPKVNNVSTGSISNLININTATVAELSTLPGIGASKAEKIVTYRTTKGQFLSIEDIKKVNGIGDEIYTKIKDYICV